MEQESLKPCPFCGIPFQFVNSPWLDGTPGYEIEHVDEMAAAEAKCPMTMTAYYSVEEAEEAINTRYERTCEKIMHDGSPACSVCHREMDYDSDYCDRCGAKVVSA